MQRYSASSIAKLPNISEADLRKLVAKGVLHPAADGGWDLVQAVQGYIDHLRTASAEEPTIWGPGELADLFDCSETVIRDLAKREIAVRLEKGKYDWRATVTNYVTHLREGASGRGGASSDRSVQDLRKATADADIREIERDRLRGDLIPADAVEAEWATVLHTLRARLLAIPSRLRARLGHLPASDVVAIDREIRDVLDDLGHDRPEPVEPTDNGPDHDDAPGGPD